ncbi:MnhB domain-containing protein [Halorhabdus amylolytica]|uniref:MnhB domain-containing protein n=1 Tax=Halorhabdus amylolytica TaxID=2559573 RepID=UPI0010AA7CE4|nr:MnhB domain-containing protein [Halorhabdus amylolytica]
MSSEPRPTDGDTTVIARTITRVVVPIIMLVAIALLLQGHNLPGGGFIAGVLTVTGFALIYVIYGLRYVEQELLHRTVVPRSLPISEGAAETDVDPPIIKEFGEIFTVGLALAAASGIVAMALGFPFLSQGVWFLAGVPLYGHMEVASALAFDLGVYLVVVGGLLTILAVVGAE